MPRLALPLALLLALAGCGGTQARPSTGGKSPAPASLRVYMLRQSEVAPVRRWIGVARATPPAALEQLLRGLTAADERAGLSTAVTVGNRVVSFRVVNGIARVRLALDLTRRGIAQVVYTLTQFPRIERVAVVTPNVAPGPLSRLALRDMTPFILVEQPTPFDVVSSPLRVHGNANAFEATLQLELRREDGAVLATKTVVATSGTGQRGDFDASLEFDAGAGRAALEAYEESAKDGSRIHVVSIPLVLSR